MQSGTAAQITTFLKINMKCDIIAISDKKIGKIYVINQTCQFKWDIKSEEICISLACEEDPEVPLQSLRNAH